jgi:hypothetical protein
MLHAENIIGRYRDIIGRYRVARTLRVSWDSQFKLRHQAPLPWCTRGPTRFKNCSGASAETRPAVCLQ